MAFALGWWDHLATAVLAGGDWSLPLTHLQDADLATVARSASLDPADTQFTVDLGTPRPIGMIVVGPINASPAFAYRVRSYSDAALTDAQYDSTLTAVEVGTSVDWSDANDWLEWEDESFWLGIVPSELTDLPFYIVRTIPAAQAGLGLQRYWKFEFVDEGNPDGSLDVGCAMLMRIFRPALNYAPDSNETALDFLTDVSESLGGLRTYWERGIRRKFRAAWPHIGEDEGFDNWLRIGLRARTSRKVFLLPEETDSGERLRLRAFPATLMRAPAVAQLNVSAASTAIDFEEII